MPQKKLTDKRCWSGHFRRFFMSTSRYPLPGRLLLAAALATSMAAYALEEDKNQMIKIQSDSAEFNESKGTAIYLGSVELTQGTLNISSKKLIIFNSQTGVNKVMAEGGPATYSQVLDEDGPPITASAGKIEYFPQEEKIVLSHDAKLSQGDAVFEGEHIQYDMRNQILNAAGNNPDDPSPDKSNSRVKMVIPPKKISP